jgi:hypothetical protein
MARNRTARLVGAPSRVGQSGGRAKRDGCVVFMSCPVW